MYIKICKQVVAVSVFYNCVSHIKLANNLKGESNHYNPLMLLCHRFADESLNDDVLSIRIYRQKIYIFLYYNLNYRSWFSYQQNTINWKLLRNAIIVSHLDVGFLKPDLICIDSTQTEQIVYLMVQVKLQKYCGTITLTKI